MVQNSWVNLTESNSGSLPAGTVLQYSCDPGYMADGPSTLTCTPLGHWSAEPPRCIQMCETPFEPENGGYACHPSPCRRFSHGTVIEFFCDQGFVLKGDYKYVTCQDGQWDASMEHASTNLSESNRGSFPVGTVLRYSCDSGFLVEGASLITCTPLGHWSSEPPRCIHSDVCLPPYDPENGGHTCHPSPCQSFSHATVIEYFCHEGFILKGDYKYLTCLNGEWDNPMPISCLMDGGQKVKGEGRKGTAYVTYGSEEACGVEPEKPKTKACTLAAPSHSDISPRQQTALSEHVLLLMIECATSGLRRPLALERRFHAGRFPSFPKRSKKTGIREDAL
ncbi:hypothetical protein CRUP_008560 [Coryphaenoides rupestris]|nr:hypothetical protein CRUP_008560 [Coryphaenoides rupestris]